MLYNPDIPFYRKIAQPYWPPIQSASQPTTQSASITQFLN